MVSIIDWFNANDQGNKNKTDIFKEYQKVHTYLEVTGYYKKFQESWDVCLGKQWQDLANLPPIILNVVGRVVDLFVAFICSEKIVVRLRDESNINLVSKINTIITKRWEASKMDSLIRKNIKELAVGGDMAFHVYWDSNIKTSFKEVKNKISGDFSTETIDPNRVFLGNTSSPTINKEGRAWQPWIILTSVEHIYNIRQMARDNGHPNPETIVTSALTGSSENHYNQDLLIQDDLIQLYTKYYIESGTVWCVQATDRDIIRQPWDTGLTLYPIAYTNWHSKPNSYRGVGAVENVISTQYILNQLHSMMAKWIKAMAFGKYAFNVDIMQEMNNLVGEAIPVRGAEDLNKVIYPLPVASMHPGVMRFIESTYSKLLDTMGATDALMGNVRPDNASAIVAAQRFAAVPLENPKQSLYQCIEDLSLIWLDFMGTYYTAPRDGVSTDTLKKLDLDVLIDIGASTFYSDISVMQTLDNLISKQLITKRQYLERAVDNFIPDKQGILDDLIEEEEAAQAMQEQQPPVDGQQPPAGGGPPDVAQVIESLPPDLREQIMHVYQTKGSEEALALLQDITSQQ